MANSQKYSIVGKDNEVVRQNCKVDITTTTALNSVPCAYLAFDRAYSEAPSVVGWNSPRASSLANVIATASGVTVWVRGLSDAPLAAGTLQVTAVVEGRLV